MKMTTKRMKTNPYLGKTAVWCRSQLTAETNGLLACIGYAAQPQPDLYAWAPEADAVRAAREAFRYAEALDWAKDVAR